MFSPVEKQKVLIVALQDPAILPHSGNDWQLIETHISWVILCGAYAYKIKKALDFGFFDGTALERRKFYCEEELRLNSRLAPELYLRVLPIGGTPTHPQLGTKEGAFEYAVEMKRFPSHELLCELVDDHRLGVQQIDQLTNQVSDFHRRIRVASIDMPFGDPEQVHAPVVENFDQIRDLTSQVFDRELVSRLEAWSDGEYHRVYKVLQQRKKQGFVRECHGDMHLGNMVMINEAPLIFDGIEFNPELYWIDVISEVAFLFMDLEYHGRQDYAFRFLNGYLESTGDYRGLAIFRYYLVYRALVRAKVASIRSEQEPAGDVECRSKNEFDRYLQLAQSYSRPQHPVLLITHGLSGSGKSTYSSQLAEDMGAIQIRSDRERQRLLGRAGRGDGASAPIASGVYSPRATAQIYAELGRLAEITLTSGYSTIVDATFLTREQREPFRQLANRLGIPIRVLWFHADTATLKQRIIARQHRGRDISEADLGVLAHQLDNYCGLDGDEVSDVIPVDTQLSGSGQALFRAIKQFLITFPAPERYESLRS